MLFYSRFLQSTLSVLVLGVSVQAIALGPDDGKAEDLSATAAAQAAAQGSDLSVYRAQARRLRHIGGTNISDEDLIKYENALFSVSEGFVDMYVDATNRIGDIIAQLPGGSNPFSCEANSHPVVRIIEMLTPGAPDQLKRLMEYLEQNKGVLTGSADEIIGDVQTFYENNSHVPLVKAAYSHSGAAGAGRSD